MTNQRILVVGATGLLGGAITRQLLEQGKEVRILVRQDSPSEELAKEGRATPASVLIAAGAQVVAGDLKDPASLAPAMEGIDTVITTANSASRWGDDNVENIDQKGNRYLIEAAQKAGVRHFIFTSASTADPNSPVPLLAAKGQTEQLLQTSGLPYTITAPIAFMEIWLAIAVGMPAFSGQPVTVVGSGERIHSFVSLGDVASFTVAAVDNPVAINQRLVIGGPEAFSFRDAAVACGDVLGRPVEVRSVAPGEPLPGLPEFMAANLAAFDTYDSSIDMTTLCETYQVELKPFESVVREMAGAAAPAGD
jgi:NADH dehydrogenase